MAIYKRSGGAWVSALWKLRVSGAWVTKASVKLRVAGAWVEKNLAVSITNKTCYSSGGTSTSATAVYRINSDGTVTGKGASLATLETWLVSGTAADFEVRATHTSGPVPNGSLGAWMACSTSREWSLMAGIGEYYDSYLTIEIRIAGTSTVLDTASIYLHSDRF